LSALNATQALALPTPRFLCEHHGTDMAKFSLDDFDAALSMPIEVDIENGMGVAAEAIRLLFPYFRPFYSGLLDDPATRNDFLYALIFLHNGIPAFEYFLELGYTLDQADVNARFPSVEALLAELQENESVKKGLLFFAPTDFELFLMWFSLVSRPP